jgi:hypothetical protein
MRRAATLQDRLAYCQADLAFHHRIVELSASPVLKPTWLVSPREGGHGDPGSRNARLTIPTAGAALGRSTRADPPWIIRLIAVRHRKGG